MPELTWDQIEQPSAPTDAGGTKSLTWDEVEPKKPVPAPVTKAEGKRPMTQEESNAAGIKGLKKFGKDVIDVADMVLSTPAFIGSMAVRGATYVGGAIQGRTHKDISSAAKMGGEFFMEDAQKMYLANPIKQLFGAKKLDEKLGESHVARAMGAVQKYVDKGGQYVEHTTKGAINADDVGFITDVVSTVAGGAAAKGTVKGAQKLAEYLKKNKPLPDADMAAGKSSRTTADDIINKYNKTPEGKADPVTPQTGKDVIDGYAQADKDIKTFNIAHDLILRGASKAEVERTIRKHKNLDIEGQMDAIMTRRREVMQGASGDMIMTEGKKPDVGYPQPEVSPRIGTDMPPDGGGVSPDGPPAPDAGTPPTPGALPAPPPKELTYNGQATIDAERAQAANESATRIPAKDGIPLEFDEAGGLRQVQPQSTEIPKPDALKTAVEKISAGKNFDLTAEEKVAWNKAKSINLESGKIDEDVLNKMGAVGGIAAATAFLSKEENREENAALAGGVAALAMFAHSRSPAVRKFTESTGKTLEDTLGLVSTTLKNASPQVWLRAVDHERRVLTSTHDALTKVNPFLESVRKLPPREAEAVDLALKNGDPQLVTKLLEESGDKAALASWKETQKFLEDTGKEMKAMGVIKGLTPNYFPRIVNDVEGLLEHMGTKHRVGLEKVLHEAETKSIKATGQGLTELEKSQLINTYMAGKPGSAKPGFTKSRVIDYVDSGMNKFYASSPDALVAYIHQAIKNTERARFFGKNVVKDPETGRFNLDGSIGEMLAEDLRTGKVSLDQVEEIRSVLHARFGAGDIPSAQVVQGYKNITNAALLGNITSAMVQFGDVAVSAYAYGVLPAVQAVAQMAAGKKKVSVKDLGLVDHISQEMASGSVQPMKIAGHEVSTAKFLDKIFKYSGFSAVDQFGKTTVINAAINKAQKQASTPKGVGDIYSKYGEAYGPDFGKLIEGLKSGELTPEVRLYLFAELSRFQPISKLEVPKAYLNNPNGRVLYMLKTYMLKQMDLVRRDSLQKVQEGKIKEGMTNLTKLAITLGGAGATTEAVRNWILGREDEFELSDVPANFLKTMGWSQYVIDKARKGEPIQAIAGTVAPPFKVWDDIITRDKDADRYIPLIGPLIHEMNKEEK